MKLSIDVFIRIWFDPIVTTLGVTLIFLALTADPTINLFCLIVSTIVPTRWRCGFATHCSRRYLSSSGNVFIETVNVTV